MNKKKIYLKGYIFSRKFEGERVPQNIQNLVLRNYCNNNGFNFLLSSVEYCMEKSFLNLNTLVNNINSYDGIIAYSIFQLPSDLKKRNALFQKILKNKKTFHFAIEELILAKKSDIEKINNIWLIKQHTI